MQTVQLKIDPYNDARQMRLAEEEAKRTYYQHSFEKMQVTLGISPAGALKRIKMGLDSSNSQPRSMRQKYSSTLNSEYSFLYNILSSSPIKNQNRSVNTRLQRFTVKHRDRALIRIGRLNEGNNGNENKDSSAFNNHKEPSKVQKLIDQYKQKMEKVHDVDWARDMFLPISSSDGSDGNQYDDLLISIKRVPHKSQQQRPASTQDSRNSKYRDRQYNLFFSPQQRSGHGKSRHLFLNYTKFALPIRAESATSLSSISALGEDNTEQQHLCSAGTVSSGAILKEAMFVKTTSPEVKRELRQSAYIEPNTKNALSGKKAHLAILRYPLAVSLSNGIRVNNEETRVKINSESPFSPSEQRKSADLSSSFSDGCNMSITSSTCASDAFNEAIDDARYGDETDGLQNSDMDFEENDYQREDDDDLTISVVESSADDESDIDLMPRSISLSPITTLTEEPDQRPRLKEITPSPFPSQGNGDDDNLWASVATKTVLKPCCSQEKIQKEEIGCYSFDEAGDTCCTPIPVIMLDVPSTELKKDLNWYSLGSGYSGIAKATSQRLARMQTIHIAFLKEELDSVYYEETGAFCRCCSPIPLFAMEVPSIELRKDLNRHSIRATFFGMTSIVAQPLSPLPSIEEITAEETSSIFGSDEEMVLDDYFIVLGCDSETVTNIENALPSFKCCSLVLPVLEETITAYWRQVLISSNPKKPTLAAGSTRAKRERIMCPVVPSEPTIKHVLAESLSAGSQIATSIAEIRGKKALSRKTQKVYDNVLQQSFILDTRPIITLSLTSSQYGSQGILQKMSEALEVLTDSYLPICSPRFEQGSEFCTRCCNSPISQF